MKRSASLLVSGVVAGVLLAGCSPAQTGGDTKCKDYLSADEKTQTEAITKMLKDQKGSDPQQLAVTGTRVAVQAWCQTGGTPDSKISGAPHL